MLCCPSLDLVLCIACVKAKWGRCRAVIRSSIPLLSKPEGDWKPRTGTTAHIHFPFTFMATLGTKPRGRRSRVPATGERVNRTENAVEYSAASSWKESEHGAALTAAEEEPRHRGMNTNDHLCGDQEPSHWRQKVAGLGFALCCQLNPRPHLAHRGCEDLSSGPHTHAVSAFADGAIALAFMFGSMRILPLTRN